MKLGINLVLLAGMGSKHLESDPKQLFITLEKISL